LTELTQPLTAGPAEHVAGAEVANGAHQVSFAELVEIHHFWLQKRHNGDLDRRIQNAYDAALAVFEHEHGRIVNAYWCSHVQSAVALTARKRHGWSKPAYTLHRESDWATQNVPEVASELHRCDELAVRAKTVLTGVRQMICMQLVVASASHLLCLVDARAGHADQAATSAALKEERAAIAKANDYYRQAANGQAQMVYFGGMASVAVLLGLVAAFWLSIEWASPVAALVAGAVGAVVSVIQRINSGKFELDYDVGAPYAFFLGGLRPLIGGTFAMVITFAFTGGLLHLPVAAGEPDHDRRLALLVLSFLAGFSERWAQDTLTSILPGAKDQPAATADKPPPAAETTGSATTSASPTPDGG
jgi:hypothetical protein